LNEEAQKKIVLLESEKQNVDQQRTERITTLQREVAELTQQKKVNEERIEELRNKVVDSTQLINDKEKKITDFGKKIQELTELNTKKTEELEKKK